MLKSESQDFLKKIIAEKRKNSKRKRIKKRGSEMSPPRVCAMCLRFFRYRINAHLFLVFAHFFKADNAVCKGEQRIVAADAYVRTRMNSRASLANEDVAGKNRLPVAAFRAETFRLAVAPVVRRTGTFFMSE